MTPRTSALRFATKWCTSLLLVCCACGERTSPQATPAATVTSQPVSALPPPAAFVPPQAWTSWRDGVKPVAPPDLSKETWRVFANREQPIQRETPVWQPVVADKAVEIRMPVGSAYRCIVQPVEITAQANDWGTELEGWELLRKLLCSADQWRTWTEYPHRMVLSVDGTRTVAYAAEAALREHTKSGEVHHTTVLFRSDQEERQASAGPARILAGSATSVGAGDPSGARAKN